MVVEKTMNDGRSGRTSADVHAERPNGVTSFVDDLASLAELQTKLTSLDLKQAVQESRLSLLLMVLGVAVMLASVLLALQGASHLLAESTAISPAWSMIVTAGIALALAVPMVGLSGLGIQHSFQCFQRSRKQLWLNLSWVQAVLTAKGNNGNGEPVNGTVHG